MFTIIKQAVINILLRMTRAYFPEPQQQLLPSRNINRYRYKLAEQFIKDNYQEPLTLEAVAERLHISPRQMQRIFKSLSGTTFSKYLEHIRLSHICKELEETGRQGSPATIDRLALLHGFTSANYLHRVFKRMYGITPKQYQERHRRQTMQTS